MLKEERIRRILDLLDRQGCVSVEEISRTFFVSQPTIYRDVREMVRRSLVVHEQGRIRRTQEWSVTTPLEFRGEVHVEEKERIARAAAGLVREGSVIFLDASTTASHLVSYLKEIEGVTVLTNGLVTAMRLKQAGVRTFCVGGILVDNSLAVGGSLSASLIDRFEIDTIFFSALGVTEKGMIVDPSEEETSLRRYLLRRVDTSVFLCDASKFGRSSLFTTVPLREVDYLVTDGPVDKEYIRVRKEIILA